ncbi:MULTISPECIES: M28 family peptidase [Bacillus]|uniref:M28 family peptidase n=1 Tax=Bacillus TaxID=1386 RepID=UPI000C7861A7|nr:MULTISPECIES: M28 family peptidase [Bacillus]MCA1036723.1 M28 family peptidase [Bacillus infantis]MDT0159149.1 M28 family peptidase [Bacillus sp. AG4(2022)]PLR74312.1 aminopeptidase [Bacillus sp. UMB0728]
MKKTFVSMSLAGVLAFGAVHVPALAQPKEAPKLEAIHGLENSLIKRISAEKIYQSITDLSQSPRVAGTASEDQAVQYIKQKFESYGYKTEIQPFTFYGYTPPEKIELTVQGAEEPLSPAPFTYTVNGNVTAELAEAGLGTKEDAAAADLEGKIALIQRGEISFAEKVLNAAEQGAAGVLIYNNADGPLSGTLGEANEEYIPAAALSKAEGESLSARLAEGETFTANLVIEGADAGEKTSHNVIAVKKPTNKKKDTGEVIVLGAHHDSVAGAPGANDDASGTAMTLELARVFKNIPTDSEIRFVTFGAEELGLLGSRHYVENLSDKEQDSIIANFNLDMVGSRDAGDLVMLTADGEPNLVTELAQKSSLKLNGTATPYGQGGRSDHVPFAEAGIPAALFIHSPSEPWYHTPEDTIDKISKDKLQDVAEIVGSAIYDQAKFDRKLPKPKKGKKHKTPHLYQEQEVK